MKSSCTLAFVFCTRVAWVCLVCLLLCKEEGSSPVSSIAERMDMGLYEVPLSLLVFGPMLANKKKLEKKKTYYKNYIEIIEEGAR